MKVAKSEISINSDFIREDVVPKIKAEIRRNTKAMFMHKIGTILVNSVDSMIISGFIGVIALGRYSNYALIAGVLAGTIGLFFSPLTSVVGHLCANGDTKQKEEAFNAFYCLNYILGFVFFLGYFAVIDGVVTLCFGTDLTLSRSISFIITLNQFTQYMRKTSLLFRDASGTFYNDRWKPVAEGVINLALSLLFVNILPDDYQLAGVIAATIITTLLICDTVEPYVVFHHVFGKSPGSFYLRNYAYICLFILCLFGMSRIVRPYESIADGIIMNGLLAVGISIIVLLFPILADRTFRNSARSLIHVIRYK